VGESGCGKSMTAYSILRLTPDKAQLKGRITLHRQPSGKGSIVDILSLPPEGKELREIRGGDIALVFQEPMTAFSPVHTVGSQMIEALLLHKTSDKREARELAIAMLDRVGISNPRQRVDEYPHQLSGGMRQRVMIGLALSCEPSLLIADEPTTALDVTIQAQVLDLMAELQDQLGMAMLYITHDLGVIAELADDVAVMYLGQIVEQTSVVRLFETPLHPYTRGLLRSMPQLGKATANRLESIEGTVPVPINVPEGCAFYDRCRHAMNGLCNRVTPPLIEVESGHLARCFLYPAVVDAVQATHPNVATVEHPVRESRVQAGLQ
jgi:peptide/nickel transport system ATP-binding protein